MSYGQKSAWGRQTGSIPNQQLNPNLFTNQMSMAPQGYGGGIGALVNQAAFSTNNMLSSQRSMVRPVSPPVAVNTQKTFLGTVTKLMETYGFVDEDVFFQTSVVRGAMPRVGERVMVEASFNPSMPFKWNAYRIQVAQQQDILLHSQQQYSSRADSRGGLQVSSAADRARIRRYSPPSARRSPIMRMRSRSPLRKESNKRDREKSLLRDSRTRSPTASKRDDKSPARRRQRIIPRYMCYIPKQIHQSNELKYKDLHKRYISMYVPSDFIRCDMSWLKSIQVDEPIKFSPHPISYTVLHKQVDLEGVDSAEENPPDADARYVVKVLLFAHPVSLPFAKKYMVFCRMEALTIGTRGKSELMGIGGAWSPSLDGENPMDPQTLVNTAVRTTRSLVGVDLSSCSKWYKMVHLHYYRAEKIAWILWF
uniref:DBC1/CARP1 catalytically inactive NUDIX hydrolase domain-containing protein n=1 Tax=Ditylenchus dipsaci TaxID=166011 RepID=A0A915DRH7_9BILA